MREWFLLWLIIILLTYSIYFSYAIFLTDYKKILKIDGGMKQLTVSLLPDPNCSMPENDAQFVGQTRWQIGLKMCLMKTLSYYWRKGTRIAQKM